MSASLKKRKVTEAEAAASPTPNKTSQKTTAPGPPRRLNNVYLVLTCDYPLQNEKWGEDSGHETQDTKVLAVFAKLEHANDFAREEADQDDESDDKSDDDGSDDESDDEVVDESDDNYGVGANDPSLFYWQEEDPDEGTARRVWVEKKTIYYEP